MGYGRTELSTRTGHALQVSADGSPVWHPIGITVDWSTVTAPTEDVVLPDTSRILAGRKYLRYGQVLVKDPTTGKYQPYVAQTLIRGQVVILNQTVLELGGIPGISNPNSDHPGGIEGGLVWKRRLLAHTTDEAGTAQVESITVLGTVGAAGAGNAAVVVTGARLTGSPIVLAVAVANDDTATLVAGKIRTALNANAVIAAKYTIGGSGAVITFTEKAPLVGNDATFQVTVDDGTSDGLTLATSTNTTPGVATDEGGPTFAVLEAAMPLLRYAGE